MMVLVMLSCLFLPALRSPAGIGLTSWLSCVLLFLVFFTVPNGIPGHLWHSIVSISDRFLHPYFEEKWFPWPILNWYFQKGAN